MRKSSYSESLRLLAEGFTLLFESILNTILNHKALTALILSLIANAILAFALLKSQSERDKYNAQLYQTEVQLSQVRIHCGLD